MACRILILPPGMEPKPPALGARSLNHWTTREVPFLFLCFDNPCWLSSGAVVSFPSSWESHAESAWGCTHSQNYPGCPGAPVPASLPPPALWCSMWRWLDPRGSRMSQQHTWWEGDSGTAAVLSSPGAVPCSQVNILLSPSSTASSVTPNDLPTPCLLMLLRHLQ